MAEGLALRVLAQAKLPAALPAVLESPGKTAGRKVRSGNTV